MGRISTILVSEASRELSEKIEGLIRKQPELAHVATLTHDRALQELGDAKLVWVELESNPSGNLELLADLKVRFPDCAFVVSKEKVDMLIVKKAMQLGVLDVLDHRSWDAQIRGVIRRLSVTRKSSPVRRPPPPAAKPKSSSMPGARASTPGQSSVSGSAAQGRSRAHLPSSGPPPVGKHQRSDSPRLSFTRLTPISPSEALLLSPEPDKTGKVGDIEIKRETAELDKRAEKPASISEDLNYESKSAPTWSEVDKSPPMRQARRSEPFKTVRQKVKKTEKPEVQPEVKQDLIAKPSSIQHSSKSEKDPKSESVDREKASKAPGAGKKKIKKSKRVRTNNEKDNAKAGLQDIGAEIPSELESENLSEKTRIDTSAPILEPAEQFESSHEIPSVEELRAEFEHLGSENESLAFEQEENSTLENGVFQDSVIDIERPPVFDNQEQEQEQEQAPENISSSEIESDFSESFAYREDLDSVRESGIENAFEANDFNEISQPEHFSSQADFSDEFPQTNPQSDLLDEMPVADSESSPAQRDELDSDLDDAFDKILSSDSEEMAFGKNSKAGKSIEKLASPSAREELKSLEDELDSAFESLQQSQSVPAEFNEEQTEIDLGTKSKWGDLDAIPDSQEPDLYTEDFVPDDLADLQELEEIPQSFDDAGEFDESVESVARDETDETVSNDVQAITKATPASSDREKKWADLDSITSSLSPVKREKKGKWADLAEIALSGEQTVDNAGRSWDDLDIITGATASADSKWGDLDSIPTPKSVETQDDKKSPLDSGLHRALKIKKSEELSVNIGAFQNIASSQNKEIPTPSMDAGPVDDNERITADSPYKEAPERSWGDLEAIPTPKISVQPIEKQGSGQWGNLDELIPTPASRHGLEKEQSSTAGINSINVDTSKSDLDSTFGETASHAHLFRWVTSGALTLILVYFWIAFFSY